jgi:hypothetical protein
MQLFDIDQEGWGSTQEYPDDPDFQPRYIVVHWGGTTRQVEEDQVFSVLRGWQRYHTGSKGMRDIAYNYAFDDFGRVMRCRGLNPGGHVKCSTDRTPEGDSYCIASIGIAWVGGNRDEDGVSPEGLARLGKFIRDAQAEFGPLEVKAHSTVKQENGRDTACPGDQLRDWIDNEGWNIVNDHFELGVEDPEVEDFLWEIFVAFGGQIDVTVPAGQLLSSIGLGSNARVFEQADANAVGSLLGIPAPTRIYKWGKERNAIRAMW